MPRLLAVNPNTSAAVTQAFVDTARAVAPDDVEIDGVTGRFGARIVSTQAEDIVAAHSALELVAEHAERYDGVILAISFDTALAAIRSLLCVPVVGITGAALEAAQEDSRRVGVIVFGAVSLPLYETVIRRKAIVQADFEVVEVASAADYLAPGAKDALVFEAVNRLAGRGADRVVICGTAIVGMADRLAAASPVPLFDGLQAIPAIIRAIKTRRNLPERLPALSESVGLSPALAALLRGVNGP